jgi:putative peptidoglycan lipid II flippase
VHVLSRAFYSLQDSRTPVRVTVTTTLLNVVLNLILVWPMREAGLALATSICGAFNALRLAWLLRKRIGSIGGRQLAWSAAKCAVAAGLAGAACALTLSVLRDAGGPRIVGKLIRVFGPMAAALAVFGITALALRMKEVGELTQALMRRRAAP